MLTRRPRIKAAANLSSSKRKVKNSQPEDVTTEKSAEKAEKTASEDCCNGNEFAIKLNGNDVLETFSECTSASAERAIHDTRKTCDKLATKIASNNNNKLGLVTRRQVVSCEVNAQPVTEIKSDSFKCPKNLNYNRSASAIDEVFTSDIEENVIQLDLQKSISGFPMSPTKSRQRIRPTPVFGQRRNSFVASSPSPHTEEENISRRERHSSTSLSSSSSFQNSNGNPPPVHKYLPSIGALGRIRTESGCSTLSDSYSKDYAGKSRKSILEEQRGVTRKDFQLRFNGDVPDKSMLKMFDLIYYNPVTNPMEQANFIQETSSKKTEIIGEGENSHFSQQNSTTAPVPQLKLGLNGEMMIDEKSLVIETTAETEARKTLANTNLIYLDENTGNNGFYKRKKRTRDWPPEETIKFYRCLQTVGTDFSLMLALFPKRNRRDLKLKFKKEERCNLNLINKALLYPKIFNIDELKSQMESEERDRLEAERQWKEIKSKDPKNIKKASLSNVSSAVRVLSDGEIIYQNENVTKKKFSRRAPKSVTQNITKNKANKPLRITKATEFLDELREVESQRIDSKQIELNSAIIASPKNITCGNIDLNNKAAINHNEKTEKITNLASPSEETDITTILTELEDGSLVFVSSVDPNNSEQTINEIFRINKSTGLLFDTPLDLPDEIMQCIISVLS